MKDPQVYYYAGQVDPTQFGVPADYLRQPNSPIQVLLHVKDRAQLAQVAAQVSAVLASGAQRPGWLMDTLQPWLREGSVKFSTREPLPPSLLRVTMDPGSVPRSAPCEVIYLPPCYLVHTPGLFEGTLQREERPRSRAQGQEHAEQSPALQPVRPRTQGHGMSH